MDRAATRGEQVEAEAKVEVEAEVDHGAPMSPTAASGVVAADVVAVADGAMAPGCGPSPLVVYDVEHLATFSTSGSHETNNGNKANMDDCNSDDGNRTTAATGTALPSAGKRPAGNHTSTTTPKVALQRLFELEKLSGIWTQHMQIELRGELMLIIDCETNSVVERFSKSCVTRPEAFNHYNDIYNNIVVFIISQSSNQDSAEEKQPRHHLHQSSTASTASSSIPSDSSFESSQLDSTLDDSQQRQEGGEGELHIFQCVSHRAQQLVADILEWKSVDGSKTTATAASSTTTIIGDSQSSSKSASTTTQSEKKSTGSEGQQPTNEKTKEDMKSSNLPLPGTGKPPVVVTSAASGCGELVPIVNVNVKETVQVFNQIAALREKSSKPTSPTNRSSSDAATASNLPSTTSAGNGGDHQAGKLALSPSGQLYKQRSIRVTLAPKFTSNEAGQAISTSKVDSSSASSSSSSSDVKMAPTTAYGAGRHQHQLANSNNNSDQLPAGGKQQVTNGTGSSSSPQARSSSTNHHYQQQQQQQQQQQHHHHQNGNSHHHHNHKSSKSQQQQQKRTLSDSTRSSHASSSSQSQLDQVTTNESYVSVLNHCFDDIEKFIIRLQQAMTAFHELQANSKRKLAVKRSSQNNANGQSANGKTGAGPGQLSSADLALLNARARGPSEDDYFEILSKFKLAFNLLAKLKGCIHEPNAPELVHFLFTPLAIIIESARNASPPIDPTLVGIPYLNQDALDLLSNCCTSKESDMWLSLGPNWTQTIDMNLLKGSRLPNSFQPIFSDGWAPVIGELELIGLVAPPANGGNSSGGPASSVATTATVAVAGELSTTTKLSPSGGHHRAPVGYDDASYPPPLQLPLEQNYAPAKLNGNQTKMEHKKRNHRHSQHAPLDAVDAYHHQQVDPYGYLHPQPEQDYQQLRSRRLNQAPKQSSRLPQDYSAQSGSNYGYGSSSGAPPQPMLASHHFPPMNLHHHHQHPTDMDGRHLVDADTIVDQSDDYSELHDHYDAHHHHQQLQHHKEGAAGPSHHHHHHHHHQHQQLYPRNNNDLNHNKRQGALAASSRKQGNLYNQASFAAEDDHQSDYLLNEAEQEAMLLDLGPAQTEWFYELQSRGAMIVRVLFTREANNDKELSVRRGEVLEVLDDTRKWWRARNINLQVAHVPHTIVAIMQGYQTLDELLASNPGDEHSQPSLLINSANHLHHHPRPGYSSRSHHNQRAAGSNNNYSHQWREAAALDKRNSKSSTAGAFSSFPFFMFNLNIREI